MSSDHSLTRCFLHGAQAKLVSMPQHDLNMMSDRHLIHQCDSSRHLTCHHFKCTSATDHKPEFINIYYIPEDN